MEPTFILKRELIDDQPIRAVNLFKMCGLCKSTTEAKNITEQKGLFIFDDKWCPQGLLVEPDDFFWFTDFPCTLRRGKKHHCQIILEEKGGEV